MVVDRARAASALVRVRDAVHRRRIWRHTRRQPKCHPSPQTLDAVAVVARVVRVAVVVARVGQAPRVMVTVVALSLIHI